VRIVALGFLECFASSHGALTPSTSDTRASTITDNAIRGKAETALGQSWALRLAPQPKGMARPSMGCRCLPLLTGTKTAADRGIRRAKIVAGPSSGVREGLLQE